MSWHWSRTPLLQAPSQFETRNDKVTWSQHSHLLTPSDKASKYSSDPILDKQWIALANTAEWVKTEKDDKWKVYLTANSSQSTEYLHFTDRPGITQRILNSWQDFFDVFWDHGVLFHKRKHGYYVATIHMYLHRFSSLHFLFANG